MIGDRPWGLGIFFKQFWYYTGSNFLSMLKEPPPDTRHGARNVREILEFWFRHSVVLLVTPHHLSLPSNVLYSVVFFSTSLMSVFSAHVYNVDFFLGYSLVLCYCLGIRNFVRWTSKGEPRCFQRNSNRPCMFYSKAWSHLEVLSERIITLSIRTTS